MGAELAADDVRLALAAQVACNQDRTALAPVRRLPVGYDVHLSVRLAGDAVNPGAMKRSVNLYFTIDTTGRGVAYARVDWHFGERRAGSVVLHERPTHAGPDHAGIAGARLGCLTVPFRQHRQRG